MQISPSNQISVMNSLLSSGGSGGGTTTGTSLSSFGPSAILSLSGSDSAISGLYSQLGQSSIPSQSQQLSKSEVKALNAAFDLIEEGRLDDAKSALDDLVKKNRNNAAAVHGLGIIESAQNNHEDAEKLYRRADFLAPGRGYGDDAANAQILSKDDNTVFEEATKLSENANTRARSIQLLQSLTTRRPDHAQAKLLLAESMLAENDIVNSITAFSRALSVAGEDELKQIESRAEELAEMLPQAPQVQRLLGRAQLRLGKYDDALETLEKSAVLSETDTYVKGDKALAHVGIGREMLDKGDISRAMTHFNLARDIDPTGKQVRIARAEGLVASAERYTRYGNLEKAAAEYNAAAGALGSDGSEGFRNRIARNAYGTGLRIERKHLAAGEDIDAEALAFHTAYRLNKDNATYKRKLADTRNTIGDQFVEEGEYSKAIGSYKEAYKLYKNDTTYKNNLIDAGHLYGDELLSEKRYSEAIDVYRSAFEVDTGNTTSKTKLADAYSARGLDYYEKEKYLEALGDFKEALHLFPNDATYQANYDLVSAYDS